MYKGLRFNFKMASHSFAYVAFFFFFILFEWFSLD